jgi:hypothetical protein
VADFIRHTLAPSLVWQDAFQIRPARRHIPLHHTAWTIE